ncbi:oligosaccharide flippase family protein [Zoogloea sp.]|uniref:oligosaccharide flippase family protein n=1 Tax=Zoogloea sp. TaxID=49181 RepID=UPI001415C97E|nr:MAG: oligosaccharide flippase family protein [Zoogloea sp.]
MGVTTLVRLLTSVFLFILLARAWSVSEFGEFMYWFTVSSVVVLIVDFGLSQSLLRDVGRSPDKAGGALRAALEGKLLLTTVVLLGCLGFCIAASLTFLQASLFFLLVMTGVVASFAEAMNATYRGLGLFQSETKIVLFSNLVYFLLAALCLYYFKTEVAVAMGMLASRVAHCLISMSVFRVAACDAPYSASFSRALLYVKKHFSFGLDAFLTNFYSSIDTILVQHYLGSGAVGIYQAGVRLMQGGNTFAQVLSNVYIPKIARSQGDGPALLSHMQGLLFFMVIVGGAVSLVFSFFQDPVVALFYGERYQDLKGLLPFFGFLLFVRYVAAAYGVGLAGLGLQSRRVFGIVGALVIFVLFGHVLVGRFQLYGLLAALIASTAFLMIYYARALSLNGFLVRMGGRNRVLIGALFLLLTAGLRGHLAF